MKLVLLLIIIQACVTCCKHSDYYWTDYYGIIPKYAVTGGLTFTGRPTYIATTYFPEFGILPTIIYESDTYAYGTANDTLLKSDKNTKILCSCGKLTWKKVSLESLEKEKCIFVDGGYENGCTLLIGRTRGVLEYQSVSGKLYPARGCQKVGLEIWGKMEEHRSNITDFEVLGYCL